MVARLIIVILALAAIFGGIFGWKQHTAQQMAAAQAGGQPPATVAVSAALSERWRPYLQVVGSLSAVAGIEVTSEVSGQVRAIHVNSGEPVKQGELLVELDDAADRAELEGLLAERTIARLRFERLSQLVKEKSISKSDYDEAQANLDATSARVAAQQALLDKKRIRAPFDGRLGIRRIDVGEYLTPGAAIVPLEKLDPIYVDFTLPERDFARISEDQRIETRLQAYPGEVFEGHIVAIDPGVQVGSRSFRVRGQLANAEEKLRPGMFADVRVLMPQEENVITVPDTAISYAPYGNSVFVVEEKDGQQVATRRQIETGRTRAGRVVVTSGLQAGERVVSAGHNKLRNGQSVVVDNKPAPGERTAAAG